MNAPQYKDEKEKPADDFINSFLASSLAVDSNVLYLL